MSPKKIEFNNGETVVYPKHGVGEIIKIESMEIASIKTMFYVVKMEQSKLTIRVPIEKQEEVGLRKISSKNAGQSWNPTLLAFRIHQDIKLLLITLNILRTKKPLIKSMLTTEVKRVIPTMNRKT